MTALAPISINYILASPFCGLLQENGIVDRGAPVGRVVATLRHQPLTILSQFARTGDSPLNSLWRFHHEVLIPRLPGLAVTVAEKLADREIPPKMELSDLIDHYFDELADLMAASLKYYHRYKESEPAWNVSTLGAVAERDFDLQHKRLLEIARPLKGPRLFDALISIAKVCACAGKTDRAVHLFRKATAIAVEIRVKAAIRHRMLSSDLPSAILIPGMDKTSQRILLEEIAAEILKTHRYRDFGDRQHALFSLAYQLSHLGVSHRSKLIQPLIEEMTQSALELRDPERRTWALISLVDNLTELKRSEERIEDLLNAALHAAEQINAVSLGERYSALFAIAEAFLMVKNANRAGTLFQNKVIPTARLIKGRNHRARELCIVAIRLLKDDAASLLEDNFGMAASLLKEAVGNVRELTGKEHRALALLELANFYAKAAHANNEWKETARELTMEAVQTASEIIGPARTRDLARLKIDFDRYPDLKPLVSGTYLG
jgi:hypothetical protein